MKPSTGQQEPHHYFAYGSNMDGERMARRCPGAKDRRPATLEDHRLLFNKATNDFDGSAAANVEPHDGERVEGALYTLSEEDLHRVDQVEGHPRHYTRRLHTVVEQDGTKTIAWVYHATPDYVRDGLRPRKEYLQNLLAGADVLSKISRERLETTPTMD